MESLYRDCHAGENGKVNCEDIKVARSSGSFTIVASLAGVDLSNLTGESTVSCSFGGFNHYSTLGSADSLNWKQRTATFVHSLPPDLPRYEGDPVERITYSWSPVSLVITASLVSLAAAELADQVGPLSTSLEVAVAFAGESGRRNVFVSGTSRHKTTGATGESPGVKLAHVKLSGKADYEIPKLFFTEHPPANVPNSMGPVLYFSGSASDESELASVQFRHNAGEWRYANLVFRETITNSGVSAVSSKAATWSGGVEAIPGLNLFEVQAIDSSGNPSLIAAKPFKYSVPTTLTVNISPTGSGSVSSGFAGTTQREAGIPYTITASPSPGYVFDGWEFSNGTESIRPTTTVVMNQDLTLTAKFVPNPFASSPLLPATFSGLITSAGNLDPLALGTVELSVTNTGAFSGTMAWGGSPRSSFRGSFTGTQGTAEITVVRRRGSPPTGVELSFDPFSSAGRIIGRLNGISSFDAKRVPFGRTNAYQGPGRYTLRIPGGPENEAKWPTGTGFATVVIRTQGRASLAVFLPDETPFTFSAPLTGGDLETFQIPIHRNLYRSPEGCFHGYLNLAGEEGDGHFFWSRPADGQHPGYPDGFGMFTYASAYLYHQDASSAPVAGLQALQAYPGILSGGGLKEPGRFTFFFPTSVFNLAHITPPAPARLGTLKFSNSTGTFSGTCFPEGASRALPIRGAVFQKIATAEGVTRPISRSQPHGGISLNFTRKPGISPGP